MFDKNTYIRRRNELKKLINDGIVILFGNNESPMNYSANAYYPHRQDSTFIYYFGQHREGLAGVIDIDNNRETLVGDDIDVVDIVWYGSVDSVSDLAAQVGVENTLPMKGLSSIVQDALKNKRKIHFLPPRHQDSDYGPAGHSPQPAKRVGFARTHQGCGEDALYKGTTGNRGHRKSMRSGI